MGELTTSQVLAEAGSGQSDPITPDPFHFLIFALPTQVLVYLNTTPARDLATAYRDKKLLHTVLTKLGYPDVIAAP